MNVRMVSTGNLATRTLTSIVQSVLVTEISVCQTRNETTLLKVQDSLFHEHLRTATKTNNSILSWIGLYLKKGGGVQLNLSQLLPTNSQN